LDDGLGGEEADADAGLYALDASSIEPFEDRLEQLGSQIDDASGSKAAVSDQKKPKANSAEGKKPPVTSQAKVLISLFIYFQLQNFVFYFLYNLYIYYISSNIYFLYNYILYYIHTSKLHNCII
jgi:hypothetical protein